MPVVGSAAVPAVGSTLVAGEPVLEVAPVDVVVLVVVVVAVAVAVVVD